LPCDLEVRKNDAEFIRTFISNQPETAYKKWPKIEAIFILLKVIKQDKVSKYFYIILTRIGIWYKLIKTQTI